jgi:hypothetical protein
MPRAASIPQHLQSEVLTRADSGLSCSEIVEWLDTAQGMRTSASSVKRYLKLARAQRIETGKSSAEQVAAPTVPDASQASSAVAPQHATPAETTTRTSPTDLSSVEALLRRSVTAEAHAQQIAMRATDPALKLRAMDQALREREVQRGLSELRYRISRRRQLVPTPTATTKEKR